MSSPDKEKHNKALENFDTFCEKIDIHNEKIELVERIVRKLFKLDIFELGYILEVVKAMIKDRYERDFRAKK
ncbi:hypothetical protein [Campylobacter mucosalis]|uniref:Putative antirepressor n=1 Tax=Campylobacter mucosalis CCUG 21559 TaxID=1032067 RepID=A0A6G5QGG8_9BACT|nr:hypothetical protein [Campylobacter mucosalis]QCD44412.1 hypothetical protein CMUC_0613 [Campylobacter mucosalis CCUG 21559]QCD44667.1 putative antirepressor [Campylobacter mucosalis CCUG 21559]